LSYIKRHFNTAKRVSLARGHICGLRLGPTLLVGKQGPKAFHTQLLEQQNNTQPQLLQEKRLARLGKARAQHNGISLCFSFFRGGKGNLANMSFPSAFVLRTCFELFFVMVNAYSELWLHSTLGKTNSCVLETVLYSGASFIKINEIV